jgi:hypothetical protein
MENILLVFVGFTLVAIIAKFVYDSYLTDNTERRWEEFKRTHPEKASRVEKSRLGAKREVVPEQLWDKPKKTIYKAPPANMNKSRARNILREMTKLELGYNENVPIFSIQRENNLWVIQLDAMTEFESSKAKEFFLSGEYDKAVNQRAKVSPIESLKLFESDSHLNINVKMEGDKFCIEPIFTKSKEAIEESNMASKKYMPTSASIEKRTLFDRAGYFDLDTLMDMSFTELYRLYYYAFNEAREELSISRQEEEMNNIEDAIEYYLTYYDMSISEIKDVNREDKKRGLRLFQKKSDELLELIEYEPSYTVQNSYISQQIEDLQDRLLTLEVDLEIDWGIPLKDLPKTEVKTKSNKIVNQEGYYLHQYIGPDIDGNHMELIQILKFVSNKHVALVELDSINQVSRQNMRQFNMALSNSIKGIEDNEIEYLDDSLGRYVVDEDSIDIKFFDPHNVDNSDFDDPLEYKRFYGFIGDGYLVLKQSLSSFNYREQDFVETEIELLRDSRFKLKSF